MYWVANPPAYRYTTWNSDAKHTNANTAAKRYTEFDTDATKTLTKFWRSEANSVIPLFTTVAAANRPREASCPDGHSETTMRKETK